MQSPFVVLADAKIQWDNSRAVRINEIFNAYYTGAITARDINMLKFLAGHGVATVSQLVIACYHGKNRIRDRLRHFAGWRLLDCFTWTDSHKNTKPKVYCLGPGGTALLQELWTAVPMQLRWRKSSAFEAAALLLGNEFFLRVRPVLGGYTAKYCCKIGPAKLVSTASCTVNGTPLVIQVIRGEGQLNRVKSELNIYEQLEAGTIDRGGKKPVILMICESDWQAVNLAEHISRNSTLTRYRLSTDRNILFKPPHLAFSKFEDGRLVTKAANIFKTPFDNVSQASTSKLVLL